MLRLHPTSHADGREGSLLVMPSPFKTLRHALPVVLEAVVGPLVLFYLLLVLTGFRGALIAALAWSYLALGRRLLKGERVSMLLLFGTILITLRTVIAFVTGSAFIYFAQPTAGTVVISLALLVSAALGRPFTQRFAHDFCPMDPAIMKRPLVRRFFIRISDPLGNRPDAQRGSRVLVAHLVFTALIRARTLSGDLWTHRYRHLLLHHGIHGDDASRRHHRPMGRQPCPSARAGILTPTGAGSGAFELLTSLDCHAAPLGSHEPAASWDWSLGSIPQLWPEEPSKND